MGHEYSLADIAAANGNGMNEGMWNNPWLKITKIWNFTTFYIASNEKSYLYIEENKRGNSNDWYI